MNVARGVHALPSLESLRRAMERHGPTLVIDLARVDAVLSAIGASRCDDLFLEPKPADIGFVEWKALARGIELGPSAAAPHGVPTRALHQLREPAHRSSTLDRGEPSDKLTAQLLDVCRYLLCKREHHTRTALVDHDPVLPHFTDYANRHRAPFGVEPALVGPHIRRLQPRLRVSDGVERTGRRRARRSAV